MSDPNGDPWTLKRFTVGVETTGVWSVVQNLQLTNDVRLDSEYHQPLYLEQEARINSLNPRPLSDLAVVSDGNHLAISDKFTDSGVRYLRGQDLTSDFFISDDNPIYIPSNVYEELQRSHMKPGDVLVSIVGTIGSVAFVTENYQDLTGSCKIAIIRPQNINPYYLAAYMASEVGQDQITRRVRGAVQQGLILPDLRAFPVPLLDSQYVNQIASLLKGSYKYQETSENLYTKAEALLLSELGLNNLDLSHQRTYTQNASQVWDAGRLDPEHFQPKYTRVETTLQSGRFPCCNLGEVIAPIMNGFDYRNYVDFGTPYIRVGDVSNGRIDLEGAAKVDITIEDVSKDVDLRPGDIVFTRKGTFGRAAVVREGQEHAIISSEIMRLRIKASRVRPDYLALFLNSIAGYQQIEQRVHGVAFFSISQDDLASITVPIPADNVQKRVAWLVAQSIEVENEAKVRLEEAKHCVENMVLKE